MHPFIVGAKQPLAISLGILREAPPKCQPERGLLCAGDGFVTDQAVVAQSGVSDASSFFNELLTRPYVQQFLVGPHIYCADVSGSSYATSGQALYSKLDTTFGYLNLQGETGCL